MKLKHLFVFLILFIVTIADSTIYSQTNSSEYYQASKVIQKRNLSAKNTKFLAFNKPFSKSCFLVYFLSKLHSNIVYKKQIGVTLKLQKQLYQSIFLLNIKSTFLIHRNNCSNSISNLYIA